MNTYRSIQGTSCFAYLNQNKQLLDPATVPNELIYIIIVITENNENIENISATFLLILNTGYHFFWWWGKKSLSISISRDAVMVTQSQKYVIFLHEKLLRHPVKGALTCWTNRSPRHTISHHSAQNYVAAH